MDESFAGIAQAGCTGRTSQDAARGVWVGLMSVSDPRDFRLLGGFDGGPSLNGKPILRERNRPCRWRRWLAVGNQPGMLANERERGGVRDCDFVKWLAAADMVTQPEGGIFCGLEQDRGGVDTDEVEAIVEAVLVRAAGEVLAMPSLEIFAEHDGDLEMQMGPLAIDAGSAESHAADLVALGDALAGLGGDFRKVGVERVESATFDFVFDHDITAVIGSPRFAACVNHDAVGRGADFIERIAGCIPAHRGDVDAFVERGVNDISVLTLRPAHESKGSALPRLRFLALEIAVHIHEKILRSPLEECSVFGRPIEQCGVERGRESDDEKSKPQSHGTASGLGAAFFFPNSDSRPMIGNLACKAAIS